ncbi:MAG: hypothetical protein E7378_01630 [Clostridiales bacterium]|nr:hypothetical protein [Clostridiales bacterium]
MEVGTNAQNNNQPNNYANLSPRTIWGKVIVYLREHRAVALHIACGDITDVSFENDVFYINTTEEFLYELLKSEDNQKDLKQAFLNFGIQKFEIVKKEKTLPKAQEDIKKLKEFFGNLLSVE